MKRVMALLLALTMVFALGVGASAAEGEKPFEGQTLKVAAFSNPGDVDSWENLAAAFEEMYGVTVELSTDATIDDVIRPQIIAGDSPDIYVPNGPASTLLSSLSKEKQLIELSDVFDGPGIDNDASLRDQITDGFLQSLWCDIYNDGHIYTAPIDGGAMGLIYNKTLFEQNGWEVPVTWDEFFELGDKAKEQGIALFTFTGIYPTYIDGLMIPALASAVGTDDLKGIGLHQEGIINKEPALTVLENIARIGTEGYLMEGSLGMNHTQTQSDMMMDKALFISSGDWMPQEMADAPRTEGFEWGMAPAPVLEEGQTQYIQVSPQMMCIPAGAENVDLAKEFIRFMYTDEAAIILARDMQAPSTTADALEVSGEYLTDEYMSMHECVKDASAAVFNWAPNEEGSRIVLSDEVYNPLTDVMSGNITGAEWADAIESAFAAINAGE